MGNVEVHEQAERAVLGSSAKEVPGTGEFGVGFEEVHCTLTENLGLSIGGGVSVYGVAGLGVEG